MTTNYLVAGAASPGGFFGGNDGALVLQTGPDGSKINALSFAADGTPSMARARGGVAQIVTFQTGALATGTTIIPLDDTIPQITEGDQYMTMAITPTNAASTLEIDVVLYGAVSAGNNITAALFQDSVANAIAVSSDTVGANWMAPLVLKHVMTAGTTSATTFRVRAGSSAAATTTINGYSGSRQFGGVMASRITIKEYLP